MNPFYVLIPVILVIATVTYGVVRALGRIWLEHRIKLTILGKLQTKPELLESFQELQDVLTSMPREGNDGGRQDYTVTGVFLALIGIGCVLLGLSWGAGTVAVGVYVGGWICIGIGIILALIGLLIRWLSRSPRRLPDFRK
jgi:hypothetical protein